VAEYDDGDVDGTEDGQLMRLLEQTALALKEGHGAVAVVANRLDLDLASTHYGL